LRASVGFHIRLKLSSCLPSVRERQRAMPPLPEHARSHARYRSRC
jgi:hypothetical protein